MILKETRFERDGLSVVIRQAGSGWVIRWSGESDTRNPQDFIKPIVDYMLDHMKSGSIVIDFTGLTFMNSSTVSPIIGMLKALNANSIDTRVEFSNTEWQQTHLRCIKTISRVLNHVTVVGRAS